MARCHAWFHHDSRRRISCGTIGIHGVGKNICLPPLPCALPHAPLLLRQWFLGIQGKMALDAPKFRLHHLEKIKVQVLPTLVFLCVFLVLRTQYPFEEGFLRAMKTPTKFGYWFTWVLLQMFLIYYVVSALFQRFGKRAEHTAIIALWFISLCAYVSLYLPQTLGKWYKTDFMMYSSFYETLKFLHFFLLGNIVHRHWQGVQRLFDAKGFFLLTVLLAFFCCADIFRWHFIKHEWTLFPKTLAMYTLMLIVVMYFRHHQDLFTRQTRIGRGLQYIGVRTLDIYLLHFLLLPELPEVGKWLNAHHPNFILDIVLSVGTALIVIAFCLLISEILRMSPFLKKYLFGR